MTVEVIQYRTNKHGTLHWQKCKHNTGLTSTVHNLLMQHPLLAVYNIVHTVLDAVEDSDLEEVSNQDTDSDVIEREKVLYIAKVFSNLLINGE